MRNLPPIRSKNRNNNLPIATNHRRSLTLHPLIVMNQLNDQKNSRLSKPINSQNKRTNNPLRATNRRSKQKNNPPKVINQRNQKIRPSRKMARNPTTLEPNRMTVLIGSSSPLMSQVRLK